MLKCFFLLEAVSKYLQQMTDLQERARFRKSFSTVESRAKLRDYRNDNSNSEYVETTNTQQQQERSTNMIGWAVLVQRGQVISSLSLSHTQKYTHTHTRKVSTAVHVH